MEMKLLHGIQKVALHPRDIPWLIGVGTGAAHGVESGLRDAPAWQPLVSGGVLGAGGGLISHTIDPHQLVGEAKGNMRLGAMFGLGSSSLGYAIGSLIKSIKESKKKEEGE